MDAVRVPEGSDGGHADPWVSCLAEGIPTALAGLLHDHGVPAENAASRGWQELTSGERVRAAWQRRPIEPVPGRVLDWP